MVENPTANPTMVGHHDSGGKTSIGTKTRGGMATMGPSILTGESIPCFFLLNLDHGKHQN